MFQKVRGREPVSNKKGGVLQKSFLVEGLEVGVRDELKELDLGGVIAERERHRAETKKLDADHLW